MEATKMHKWIICGVSICIFAIALAAGSPSFDKPVMVNLMIDLDLPPSATAEQISDARADMININNEAHYRKINWTLILTQDASSQTRVFLAELAFKTELMASGNHTDEKLSTYSYSEQKSIIERSKFFAESCKVCNVNEKIIKGFMPQSFDQNEDTFKALDDLGFEYDSGFQSGILYLPGHENDAWPYKVENHNFYAVPVSTYVVSGEKIPLDDRYIKDKGLSSSQWKDMLCDKFDEALEKDEPMVVSLSSTISGSGDYLDSLKQFMDYAQSKNAKFISGSELVSISKNRVNEENTASSMTNVEKTTSSSSDTSACPECDAAKKASRNVKVDNGTIQVQMT
jgi:hypothetical protein